MSPSRGAAAPYFSFQGMGSFEGAYQQFREIKAASNELVVRLGGTVTHHHAVGRDHRPGYEKQIPPLFIEDGLHMNARGYALWRRGRLARLDDSRSDSSVCAWPGGLGPKVSAAIWPSRAIG